MITNPLAPFPFPFARLNSLQAAVRHSYGLSDPTTLRHHLVTTKAHVDCNLSFCFIWTSIQFTTQQQRHFPNRLKRHAKCKGNAIEQSSKLSHKSLEIRNKWSFHFWAIICPNPKWHSCFYYKQLSVPIDGGANFKFLALSRPNECNKYRYWTH